jgi:hypothetical protein
MAGNAKGGTGTQINGCAKVQMTSPETSQDRSLTVSRGRPTASEFGSAFRRLWTRRHSLAS